jgi:hypothetical protein
MSRINARALEGLPAATVDELRRVDDRITRLEAKFAEGFGSPEGAVVGRKGRIYQQLDGTTKTCVWVFEGTDGDVTGWQQLRT